MDITVVGIDLGKSVFHLHGIDARGKEVFRKRLSRSRLADFVAQLPQCLIAMEACGGSHYWGRRFREFGHEVRLIAPQYVKPYVKTNKNDMADAAAIAEAATRGHMSWVEIKSEHAQAVLSVHRVIARRKRARTALINELRGILLEFGIALPKGVQGMKKRLWELRHPVRACDLSIPEPIIPVVDNLLEKLTVLEAAIAQSEQKIEAHVRDDEQCQRLMTIPGIGKANASALVATVGNAAAFDNARQFAAWLGLVPRQQGTGGVTRLMGISKRGDPYLRYLLVHAARACILHVTRKKVRPENMLADWIDGLVNAKHPNVAALAVANKLARMVYAMLRDGTEYAPAVKQAAV